MDYAQAEQQYKALKQQFSAGAVDEASFKAKLHDLMVQDKEERWWMIGYDTGQWYVHDGQTWTRADPPGMVRVETAAAPAQKAAEPIFRPSTTPAQPGIETRSQSLTPSTGKKMSWLFWLVWVGSIVVSFIVIGWISESLDIYDYLPQAVMFGGGVGVLQWLILRYYGVRNGWLWIVGNVLFLMVFSYFANQSSEASLFSLGLFLLANLIGGGTIVYRRLRNG